MGNFSMRNKLTALFHRGDEMFAFWQAWYCYLPTSRCVGLGTLQAIKETTGNDKPEMKTHFGLIGTCWKY
jgi:hypothetical protein